MTTLEVCIWVVNACVCMTMYDCVPKSGILKISTLQTHKSAWIGLKTWFQVWCTSQGVVIKNQPQGTSLMFMIHDVCDKKANNVLFILISDNNFIFTNSICYKREFVPWGRPKIVHVCLRTFDWGCRWAWVVLVHRKLQFWIFGFVLANLHSIWYVYNSLKICQYWSAYTGKVKIALQIAK